MIVIQAPHATHVAGFRTWKKLGRFVRKGEKGIVIIAPMVSRKKAEDSSKDQDDPSVRGFRGVHVFDISQTEGEPLPELAKASGDPGENFDRLRQIVAAYGITLVFEEFPDGTYGASRGGEIALASDMPPAQQFSVLVHELAHELLHRRPGTERLGTTRRETEAEAVAHVVLTACGMQNGTAASDYIQLYNGTEELLNESLDRIQRTVAQILPGLKVAPELSLAC